MRVMISPVLSPACITALAHPIVDQHDREQTCSAGLDSKTLVTVRRSGSLESFTTAAPRPSVGPSERKAEDLTKGSTFSLATSELKGSFNSLSAAIAADRLISFMLTS
mmetsp:Transcript_33496/g.105512  ORF Transcript_33496/g.105512 Transcript_33496/m.105512 type:complete len:108 (-) Transcript_33496:449-772(-)